MTTHLRLVKDNGRWHAHLNPDRSVTWTSPTGRTYTVPAPTYPIDGTGAMCVRNDNRDDTTGEQATEPAVVIPDENPQGHTRVDTSSHAGDAA